MSETYSEKRIDIALKTMEKQGCSTVEYMRDFKEMIEVDRILRNQDTVLSAIEKKISGLEKKIAEIKVGN